MITADTTTRLIPQTPAAAPAAGPRSTEALSWHPFQALAGLLVLLACLGASLFAYQYFLVPQPKDFQPDWHDAQWIEASDNYAATTYYRYVTTLQVSPDNAFVTIAASQVFRLYINGTLIGTNSTDFANYPRSYIYEVMPSLILGVNVIAIRVDNLDGHVPLLRASFGIVIGAVANYYGTGSGAETDWLATTQTIHVYPQNTSLVTAETAWTSRSFDASSWLAAQAAPTSAQASLTSRSPLLTVNPLLYEQPISPYWFSAGAGQDGYFVQRIVLPQGTRMSWLRFAATGTAQVFINGNLIFTWNYHRTSFSLSTVNQTTGKVKVRHIPELVLGVYDVSPFLRAGVNTIAIHISLRNASGLRSIQVTSAPALSMDVMVGDDQGHFTWLGTHGGWQVSHMEETDWINAGAGVRNWASPTLTDRPDGYSIVYASRGSQLTRGQQAIQSESVLQTALVILLSIAAVVGLWLLISLTVIRRFTRSAPVALEIMSLAYLPALAAEGLLLVISKEPQVVQPFPYTSLWGLLLLLGVAAGYLLLGLSFVLRRARESDSVVIPKQFSLSPTRHRVAATYPSKQETRGRFALFHHVPRWLRMHWPILLLILLTVPFVFYDLGYEAYWQDELVSYLVARSIQHIGLPMLPSGFVYPKGELYSYLLALFMSIFGDRAGAPRAISGVEYLLTLALLYRVGCYFFDRRVALIAVILLAFFPHELIWARQMRMYQQAQLLTLLTAYLFYRAVQEYRRASRVYLATGALLLTYLSHEEIFIVLPALVICLLALGYALKERRHRLPSFLYQKHWWIAAAIAVSAIGLQLLITKVTHPPTIGTDNTTRPMIQLTTDNIPYYLNMLFTPTSNDPSNSTLVSNIPSTIILDSILMVLGCLLAVKSDHLALRFIALFFVIGFLTLVFVFTMQADRYFYPLVTFYCLLAAYAFVKSVRMTWAFARTRASSSCGLSLAQGIPGMYRQNGLHAHLLKWLIGLSAALVLCSVLLLPMLPLNNYNLFVSRLFNFPYYHHFGDYDEAGQYIEQHFRQGDIILSIIPDTIVMYYAGQSDYFFSINHALFLLEQNGHVVDTYSGKIALLRQSDLDAVLDTHARVWLFSADNHYQHEVLKHFLIPPDFHIVYSGADSIVLLRGS